MVVTIKPKNEISYNITLRGENKLDQLINLLDMSDIEWINVKDAEKEKQYIPYPIWQEPWKAIYYSSPTDGTCTCGGCK